MNKYLDASDILSEIIIKEERKKFLNQSFKTPDVGLTDVLGRSWEDSRNALTVSLKKFESEECFFAPK